MCMHTGVSLMVCLRAMCRTTADVLIVDKDKAFRIWQYTLITQLRHHCDHDATGFHILHLLLMWRVCHLLKAMKIHSIDTILRKQSNKNWLALHFFLSLAAVYMVFLNNFLYDSHAHFMHCSE